MAPPARSPRLFTHRYARVAPDMPPADYIPPDPKLDAFSLATDDAWDRNLARSGRLPSAADLRADPRMLRPGPRPRCYVAAAAALALLLAAAVLLALRNTIYVARLRHAGVPPGLYSRDGLLYVGRDTPFRIKGFSWFGMETELAVPGGLEKVPAANIFDFAQAHNFNSIRLPLSVENIVANRIGNTNAFFNPTLTGLTYLDMVKAVVRRAAEENVLVLLDAHRLESHEVQSAGLWYTNRTKEERLFLIWTQLCDLLRDEWNVLGADVYNEPWDALWNTSNAADDWKSASERLGNHIHKSCPSWLIFIEGVGDRAKTVKTGVFWAENLHVMHKSPPELILKSKTALSPHVYGPSVFNQSYFEPADFPNNMPAIWDDHFGGASDATGLATIVGEWGGWFYGKDNEWQRKFLDYLLQKQFSFFYWCLNPESGDTGGLLQADWKTPETAKLDMLAAAPSTKVQDHAVHFKYWRNWRAG